jgi:hypothetical protein
MKKKLILTFLGLIGIVVIAGGLFLATYDMPPPTQRMEKPVLNERTPR